MDCRVIKVEQGTDEWDALRRARVTASRIGDVMAKPHTKRHKGYKREVTLELLGHTEVEESPEWFRHGREMEPRALSRYEFKHDVVMDHDVFLIHKDYDWMSVSPDGLTIVGDSYAEGVEVKCRKLYKEFRAARDRILKFKDVDMLKCIDPSYRFQVQAAMWLTGWDHWWYVNYYEVKNNHGHATGDWKLQRVPIPRDQNLIDQIELACMNFYHECCENACLEYE